MLALLVLRVSISTKHLCTITPMEVTLPQTCMDLKHNLLHMVSDVNVEWLCNQKSVANIRALHLIFVLQQMLMSVNVGTVHTPALTVLVLLCALVKKDSTSLLMAGLALVSIHFNLLVS